jgi:hypothetical protein
MKVDESGKGGKSILAGYGRLDGSNAHLDFL